MDSASAEMKMSGPVLNSICRARVIEAANENPTLLPLSRP